MTTCLVRFRRSAPHALALIALVALAPNLGAQGSDEGGPEPTAPGWMPRLIFSGGGAIDPKGRGRHQTEYVGIVGVDVARRGLLGERVRLRADYLASYRPAEAPMGAAMCASCSSFLHGMSLSLVATPFRQARLRPYLLAGYGIYSYHSEGELPQGRAGLYGGMNVGLGVETTLSDRAELFLELRTVGAAAGVMPLTGGARLRF